jgi:hypothetical protein
MYQIKLFFSNRPRVQKWTESSKLLSIYIKRAEATNWLKKARMNRHIGLKSNLEGVTQE